MMQWAFAAILALSTPAPGVEPPPQEQVMAVPVKLRAQLHERVIAGGGSDRQRYNRLLDFVFAMPASRCSMTSTAPIPSPKPGAAARPTACRSRCCSWRSRARPGCAPMARKSTRCWSVQADGIVYNASPRNVGVRIDGRASTIEISQAPVIARHAPKIIPDQRALAHYYNNRGAELLAAGDIDAAFRHMQSSLDLDPDFASSWNNLGVLHLRKDNLRAAENAYLAALDLEPKHGPTLFNIVGLYGGWATRNSWTNTAALEKARLADPFHQFLLAMEAEERGDHPRAVLPTSARSGYIATRNVPLRPRARVLRDGRNAARQRAPSHARKLLEKERNAVRSDRRERALTRTSPASLPKQSLARYAGRGMRIHFFPDHAPRAARRTRAASRVESSVGQRRIRVIYDQRDLGAAEDDGIAALIAHPRDDLLDACGRCRLEHAAHQFIHDDAVDVVAFDRRRAHVFQAARGKFFRIHIAVDQPARAGQAESSESARDGVCGNDFGDVQPRQRRSLSDQRQCLMDVLPGRSGNPRDGRELASGRQHQSPTPASVRSRQASSRRATSEALRLRMRVAAETATGLPCRSCDSTMPRLRRSTRRSDMLGMAVVSRGETRGCPGKADAQQRPLRHHHDDASVSPTSWRALLRKFDLRAVDYRAVDC